MGHFKKKGAYVFANCKTPEDQYASLNEVNSRVASQRFMERIKSASLPCQLIGDSRR
ncbi:hypothetical protein [Dubosiella newyorkensis]|uniref:hypothetical protein n=1 Tax=Dubosiella newyorkensis TaxID=1862672 RepID=UPI003F6649C4